MTNDERMTILRGLTAMKDECGRHEEIDMMGEWAVIKMPGSLSDRRILIEDGWKIEEVKP